MKEQIKSLFEFTEKELLLFTETTEFNIERKLTGFLMPVETNASIMFKYEMNTEEFYEVMTVSIQKDGEIKAFIYNYSTSETIIKS